MEKKGKPTMDVKVPFREYLCSLSNEADPGNGLVPAGVSLAEVAELFDMTVPTLRRALQGPIGETKALRILGFIAAKRISHWPDLPQRLADAYLKLEAPDNLKKLVPIGALEVVMAATSSLIPDDSFDLPFVLCVRGWMAMDAGGIYGQEVERQTQIGNRLEAKTRARQSTEAYGSAEQLFATAHDDLGAFANKLPPGYTRDNHEEDLQKMKINQIGAGFNQYQPGARSSSEPLLKRLREAEHLETLVELSNQERNKGAWSVHYHGLVTASVIGEYLSHQDDDTLWTIKVPELETLCKTFHAKLATAISFDPSEPLPGCRHSLEADPDLAFFRRIVASEKATGSRRAEPPRPTQLQ